MHLVNPKAIENRSCLNFFHQYLTNYLNVEKVCKPFASKK
nr:MAG TPA: hypothetical protein [Caudoviricetes sp.]